MTHRFPALIAAPPPAQGRLWLTGARLFDGTGAPLRENTAILVQDGMYLHRRPDPLAEPHLLCDPGRIWLVLQRGVPVAGQALAKPAS